MTFASFKKWFHDTSFRLACAVEKEESPHMVQEDSTKDSDPEKHDTLAASIIEEVSYFDGYHVFRFDS